MTAGPHGNTPSSVKAIYGSSTHSKTFEKSLSSPGPTEAKSKTAYLAGVRSATKQLQDDINVFLTAKMEEDKANASAPATGSHANESEFRDEEEEQTYGEEKIDQD